MKTVIVAAIVCVGLVGPAQAQAVETYPGVWHTPQPAAVRPGGEFPWSSARSPYAEGQSGGAPVVLTVTSSAPTVLVSVTFDAPSVLSPLSLITSAVWTLDGVAESFPSAPPQAGGPVVSPFRSVAQGEHQASVAVCNAFGCGPTLDFVLRVGDKPGAPSNLKLALQQVADALGGLAVSVRALAVAQP